MTSDEAGTLEALDAALRAHAAQELRDDGEVITAWLALAAVVRADGGGLVISMPSHEVMPIWQARGILTETLAMIDRRLARDELDNDDE